MELFLIAPTSSWKELKDGHRTFILNYNRAIRHSEDLPEIPSGVKIGERKKSEKRVCRVCRNRAMDCFDKTNDDTSSEAQPESDADESIGSLGEIEENVLIKPGNRKKVQFHLHGGNSTMKNGNDTDSDTEDEKEKKKTTKLRKSNDRKEESEEPEGE